MSRLTDNVSKESDAMHINDADYMESAANTGWCLSAIKTCGGGFSGTITASFIRDPSVTIEGMSAILDGFGPLDGQWGVCGFAKDSDGNFVASLGGQSPNQSGQSDNPPSQSSAKHPASP